MKVVVVVVVLLMCTGRQLPLGLGLGLGLGLLELVKPKAGSRYPGRLPLFDPLPPISSLPLFSTETFRV